MGIRSCGRGSLAAAGALVMVAGWLVATPSALGAVPHSSSGGSAGCGAAGRTGASDVDGDGVTDPVVGLPGRSPTGGIVVRGSRAGDPPRFLAGSAFAGIDASRSFGTAIARFDINNDGCDDLAVSDPDHAGGGAVDLLWGSPSGIQTAGAVQVLDPQSDGGDDFGAAVALYKDANTCASCIPEAALWVGAPGRTVEGNADAGAVEFYRVALDGTTTHAGTVSEAGLRGSDGPTRGNRFGSVMSAFLDSGEDYEFYSGSALVGVPNETVNGQLHAGAAIEVEDFYDPIEQTFTVGPRYIYTQASAGVAGTPEAGDEFGAAVSVADPYEAAIGVPGEDVGAIRDAGLVQTFGYNSDVEPNTLVPDGAITQNSPGVPGVAEAGDHFGASVAVGVPNLGSCPVAYRIPRQVVIGVPGEDNAGHADSGTVAQQTITRVTGPNGQCSYAYRYRAFTQGPATLLRGENEAGDEVGAAVDVTQGANQPGLVIIGAPGESIGGLADAGTVQTYDNRTGSVTTVGNVGGRQARLRFGAVLTVEG